MQLFMLYTPLIMDGSALVAASLGHQVECSLSPMVVFAILDHYMRRTEGQERVIGTLLGANNDGQLEITNCFPVPHTEGDTVRDKKFFFSLSPHTTFPFLSRLVSIWTFIRQCFLFIVKVCRVREGLVSNKKAFSHLLVFSEPNRDYCWMVFYWNCY